MISSTISPAGTRLLRVAMATLVLVLAACASAPAPDAVAQRFDAAFGRGSEKFAQGELAQAAQAYAQAERAATLYDRRDLRIKALFALAAVAATREQDGVARQAYGQALAEAQGLQDAHSAAIAQAGLADAQRRAGDYAAALSGYEQALSSGALLAASTEGLQATLGRALVWHATGRSAEAQAQLQTLEAQARAAASPVLASVLANQAVLLRDAGDLPGALDRAEAALALDRRQASPFALAADLELLAGLYRQGGQLAEARASAERALRIVQATGQAGANTRLRQFLDSLP